MGVRETSEGLRRRNSLNHELWRRHRVFTQVRRVSIPQRAYQLNCSTPAYADGHGAYAGAPALAHRSGRRTHRSGTGPRHRSRSTRMRFPLLGELSCPVSAASATASASAPSAGRRPASAGRATTAGGGATSAGRSAVAACPPAAAAAAAAVRAPPAAVGTTGRPCATARGRHEDHHEDHCDQRHHKPCDHGVSLLPFPRNGPGRPPVGASRSVRGDEMPALVAAQCRVEELQSLGGGWRA